MALKWMNENDDHVEPHSVPDDEVWALIIDDEEFSEGDDVKLIYEDVFKGFSVSDLPENFAFELVAYFDHNGLYEQGALPFEMARRGEVLEMSVLDGAWPRGRQQEYEPVDLERLAVTRKVLEEVADRDGWIREIEWNEDDDYHGGATLQYKIVVPADQDADEAFQLIAKRHSLITTHVEGLMGERSLNGILASGDEKLFTMEVVIPALERMGMLDVRYVHGADEHGRDVLYRYRHPLGFDVLGAVQCKAGDVTGRAGRQVDELLAQIQDSFAFPVYDLNLKAERPVSEVIVAISGDFKGSAVQRIRQRLQAPTASRVWFWSARDFRDLGR